MNSDLADYTRLLELHRSRIDNDNTGILPFEGWGKRGIFSTYAGTGC